MSAEEEYRLFRLMHFLAFVPPADLGAQVSVYLCQTNWLLTEGVKFMEDVEKMAQTLKHYFHEDPLDEDLRNKYFELFRTVRKEYGEIKQTFQETKNIMDRMRSYFTSAVDACFADTLLAPLKRIPRVIEEIIKNIGNRVRELDRLQRWQRLQDQNICRVKNFNEDMKEFADADE